MKVGILTFHFVSNQGGVLQCYASQRFLEKNGHEVKIIDYRPAYHIVRYMARKNPFQYAAWFWKRFRKKSFFHRVKLTIRSFARCVYMNLKGTDQETSKLFDVFIEKNLHLSRRYRNIKELQRNPPGCDAYVCGSDQIWNPDVLNADFDSAYFLNFGQADIPHVAYAVSTGRTLSEGEIKKVSVQAKRLTAISMREYSREIAAEVGDIHVCIDPTLLLDAADYEPVESGIAEEGPYIFVYGFQNSEGLHRAVEMAEARYHCRVINGSPHRIHLSDKAEKMRDYAPDRFLTLIKNAQCVVTNSFHGTVFSIIYKKDFITVPHSSRSTRMTELLQKLGLTHRLWNNPDFSFTQSIDYTEAYRKLEQLRTHSAEFLLSAIGGAKGEEIPHYADEIPEDQSTEHHETKAYYGYFRDRQALKASASGGAASALATHVIDHGGIVFGVAYSDDFKSARYVYATTRGELDALKGSKYIYPDTKQNDNETVFDDVEEALQSGKTVLFIGLGCLVAGLYKRLELHDVSTERLYTVDLICHGPTLPQIQQEFIETLERQYDSKVISFNTRYGEKGWSLPYVRIGFENGKSYMKPLYETDFGFAMKYLCRRSCYDCKFKADYHPADITVGDYWGLKPGMKQYNPDGVSVLLSRTEKGEALIADLDHDLFFVGDADLKAVVRNNPMYLKNAKKPSFYDTFKHDVNALGLHDAVRHSTGYRIYRKAAWKNRIQKWIGRK